MSAIEDTVCAKILARANVGLQTYGKRMDRKDLTWLQVAGALDDYKE